ncbi:hypothetical protein [Caballeronia sp. LZ019]|nr:hypothetical protein [Caballeronia sp. LZ019]MDR5807590.1 hypothetical protein [Caballeronia sp. LZ019]
MTRYPNRFGTHGVTADERTAYRVYCLAMAKHSQFSTDSIGRGIDARATGLAIVKRIDVIATSKTRITKISIKAITIR